MPSKAGLLKFVAIDTKTKDKNVNRKQYKWPESQTSNNGNWEWRLTEKQCKIQELHNIQRKEQILRDNEMGHVIQNYTILFVR